MNFLQLAQRAAVECGVSGTLQSTLQAPASLARVVNWVGDAWNDVQTVHDDGDWMRASSIIGTGGISVTPIYGRCSIKLGTAPPGPAGVALGVDIDSFGKWVEDTFRCYSAVAAGGTTGATLGVGKLGQMVLGTQSTGAAGSFNDETFLDCIDYDNWRNSYMLGAMRDVRTRPYVIAVGPDESLNVGPPTNGNYTITGDYFVAPSVMAVDADVPTGLPVRWHLLIVYKAMIKCGYYEAAPEVLQRGQAEWDAMLRQLEARRLPSMGFAGALA